MKRLSIPLALGIWTAGAAAGPADFSAVQVQTQEVAPGVYMLAARGGNIGVSAGADGVFLIDDQYAPLTPKIRAAVASLSDQPVRFVLNTHWHGDHTGGNENLGKAGALIVAHDNVRLRMASDQFMEAFNAHVPASPKAALPVVTFNDTVTFHVNGQELHAFHVPPAHTDGDAVVVFRGANVIHAGDLVFWGLYPVIDFGSGGHIGGIVDAVDRILALADDATKIIPGHGALIGKAELKDYRDLLATVRDRVTKLVKQGKSMEQVVAAKPTVEFDAKWGGGFLKPDPWVEMVYKGVARHAAQGKKR